MKPIRLIREVRLKDFEAFKVKKDFYGDTICYMLIADFKRPSSLNDFPSLKNIEDENEFGRGNFIKVIFLYSSDIETAIQNELVSLAGTFLENKDDCHWNAEFEKIDDNTISTMNENKTEMLKCFDLVLQKYNLTLNLSNIDEDKFKYLSQD